MVSMAGWVPQTSCKNSKKQARTHNKQASSVEQFDEDVYANIRHQGMLQAMPPHDAA